MRVSLENSVSNKSGRVDQILWDNETIFVVFRTRPDKEIKRLQVIDIVSHVSVNVSNEVPDSNHSVQTFRNQTADVSTGL